MVERREITIPDVLNKQDKQNYRNILFLLCAAKGNVQLKHLRYACIENYDKMPVLNKGKPTKLKINLNKAFFPDGLIDTDNDKLTDFLTIHFLDPKYKVKGRTYLNFYLNQLQKLELISKYWIKGEKTPYYMLSDYGTFILKQFQIHHMIDRFSEDDLTSLYYIIFKFKYKIKD